MRKEEFLTALRAGLTGLLPEGVEKLVEFCSEMIDDRMEDGLTEEEAVAAAGSLDELIQQAKTELLPVKTANFTEKSTFGDTLRTYTAESSICGVAADCGPADFILLPSENNTCRVECAENETVHYVVTTENSVLHIRRADSRTVFSFFKFYRALRSEPVRVYLPQDAYKSLEVKVTSGDIARGLHLRYGFPAQRERRHRLLCRMRRAFCTSRKRRHHPQRHFVRHIGARHRKRRCHPAQHQK